VKAPLFAALNAARAARRPAALVTRLTDGAQALLVDRDPPRGDLALEDAARTAVEAKRAVDASGFLDEDETLFVCVYAPPARLAIVGAAHIAQALAPMAAALDYAPTVIDPRSGWAAPERFPNTPIIADWPDDALAGFDPDMRTAVVCLTHDPKLDDPALIAALASPAFYVGALGSRRTHAKRLERLAANGVEPAAADRIRAPVGLAIGAKAPAEIALAILAEITAARRGAG